MKKLAAFLLILSLGLFSFAGCSGGAPADTDANDDSSGAADDETDTTDEGTDSTDS